MGEYLLYGYCFVIIWSFMQYVKEINLGRMCVLCNIQILCSCIAWLSVFRMFIFTENYHLLSIVQCKPNYSYTICILNNINFVLATVCDTWTQWTDCSSVNKDPCTPGKRERERNCPAENEKEVEPCMNDCPEPSE